VFQCRYFIVTVCFGVFAHQDSGGSLTVLKDIISNQAPSRLNESKKNDDHNDSSAAIIVQPRVINFVKTHYPDNLLKNRIAGPVVFDLLISEKGTVDSAAIIKRLHPVLDSLALAAVRSFTFAPAKADAIPIPVILRYAYRFSIEDSIIHYDTKAELSEISICKKHLMGSSNNIM
jgi:TonB family protein